MSFNMWEGGLAIKVPQLILKQQQEWRGVSYLQSLHLIKVKFSVSLLNFNFEKSIKF